MKIESNEEKTRTAAVVEEERDERFRRRGKN